MLDEVWRKEGRESGQRNVSFRRRTKRRKRHYDRKIIKKQEITTYFETGTKGVG